jgi:hypothetical protein
MNKYILTCCLVLLFAISFAQNYRTFSPVSKAIFKNNNPLRSNANIFAALCYNTNLRSYYGAEIESFDPIIPGLYYHFSVLRKDATNTCNFIRMPNWTGKITLVKSNGENVLLNNSGDSIRIMAQAPLNYKWHLYDFTDGKYFEAEIIDKIYTSVLGNNDSVKVINLTLKNSEGNTENNQFNNRQIHLSKNYGIIRGYEFSSFPYDTSSFTLVGLSTPKLGIQNISAREVFNYEIGDEFHIEYNNSLYSVSSTIKKEKKIVLTKRVSTNDDTIDYTFNRTLYTKFTDDQNPNNSYTTKVTTVESEKIIVSESTFINPVPSKVPTHHAKFGDYTPNCLYKTNEYNGKFFKVVDKKFIKIDDCLNDSPSGSMEEKYIEGLGYYYEGDASPDQNHKRLVYFKKGEETWGSPIDFDLLTPTKTRINENLYATLQPNPFSEQSIFKINNATQQTYKLVVADIQGKLVKEYTFNGDQVVITNDTNLKGLYFYKLYSENNEVGTGKLLIY